MDRIEAATYLRDLTAKLARIRNYIIANASKREGKLVPESQYAVRITESAARELNRCYQVDFGDDPETRAACQAEQKLKRRDRGEIVRFENRNHLVGCFTCQACDFDYVSDGAGGPPVRRPNSRLCPECKAGVQHSAVLVRHSPVGGPEIDSGYPNPQIEATIAPEANLRDVEVLVRVYLCDSCGAEGKSTVLVVEE